MQRSIHENSVIIESINRKHKFIEFLINQNYSHKRWVYAVLSNAGNMTMSTTMSEIQNRCLNKVNKSMYLN